MFGDLSDVDPRVARYLIHGLSCSKDEVHGTFNVAIFEVVSPKEVAHRVLDSNETAIVEGCLVP